MLMPSPTWLFCTAAMIWPTCSVPAIGFPLLMTPLFPEGSPPVQAWRPIRCCLPKPKLVSSREAARSAFLLCLKMNKWYSLRKLMLGQLLPSPGLEHSASSWVPWTWKASWEQPRWWVPLCMVRGMSGQAMPTFIFMILNPPVHRQMRHSLICSSRTVACLVRTSPPQQSWRPYKIMSLIITRYVAYISLWLTCGGLGSTTLPGPGRSQTNFGVFLIMKTHAVWAPSGQMAPHHHSGAVDLPLDMRWMALNAQVTWCGLKETGNFILCWIPPQRTHSFWIKTSFAPWACNTSMIPLHSCLKFEDTLPEKGYCVSGLALIKNIESTMKHGQQTEQKSRQRLSSWQPMRWILSLPRLSQKVVPVTRTWVKVRVTRSRMTLPLRWQLMQNSMSSRKLLMVQWARTFMTKRISLGQSTANFRNWSWFLRDGPWRGCLFLYKNVWTTLIEYWLGVAGKFRLHV